MFTSKTQFFLVLLCTSAIKLAQSVPVEGGSFTIASFTQQGPKLARTWTFKQTSNSEEDPAAVSTSTSTSNSTASKTLHSSSLPNDATNQGNNVNAQGAVFYFPQECNKVNNGEESNCSQQIIEKSVVLEDAPKPQNNTEEKDDDDDDDDNDNDKSQASKVPEPKTYTLPQNCENLKDGTKLCEQKIIMELYLPIEEAEKELNQVLTWNHQIDSSLFGLSSD